MATIANAQAEYDRCLQHEASRTEQGGGASTRTISRQPKKTTQLCRFLKSVPDDVIGNAAAIV